MTAAPPPLPFFPTRPLAGVVDMNAPPVRDRDGVGFRRGDVGTHSSRTLMLAELSALLDVVPANASDDEIAAAVRQGNCLGKSTASTRRR